MEMVCAAECALFQLENKNKQSMTRLGAFASYALEIGNGREEESTHWN